MSQFEEFISPQTPMGQERDGGTFLQAKAQSESYNERVDRMLDYLGPMASEEVFRESFAEGGMTFVPKRVCRR